VFAPIVAWWACGQIIALLPLLAGADINLSAYQNVLPAAVALSMVARVLLEEAAGQWFPNRLAQTNETSVPKPPAWQRWFGVALRAAIFYFAAGALIGDCWQLVVGSFLFVLPNILGIYASRFPNSARLHAILTQQVARIAELGNSARASPARSADAIRTRLAEQVARLLETGAALDPDRLHQEAVLAATRADIQEELDRLDSHVEAAQQLLGAHEAIGRKFDFLAQEFNREANTLCSKASDRSLSLIGLDLKTVIDQMREQVQNIE
jgi:hypothetical protein